MPRRDLVRPSARWYPNVLLALALAACGQTEPFTNPDFSEPGPFNPNPPVRLTYNPGPDVTPAFLPGGQVAFGFTRPGEPNQDQCLGVLPNQGGTTIAESCPRTPGSRDSTERYEEARALGSDTVALVYASRFEGRRFDDNAWIGRAPWRSATEFTPRLQFPFTAPSGRIHFTPTHLSVTGPGQVAYLATNRSSACPGVLSFPCPNQMLVTFGTEVGALDIAGEGPPTILSGTEYATSVAPGRTPGSILFTLTGDLSVYERDANGAITTLATLRGFLAVRDPTLAGSRLVSIVDGSVDYFTLPDSTTVVQVSGRGSLMMTDLVTGESLPIADGLWKRPYISADARQVVADNGNDIYRIDLP